MYAGNNYYLPLCKSCLESLFYDYVKDTGREDEAVRRICMRFDYYWSQEIFDTLNPATVADSSAMLAYIRRVNNAKYSDKTYADTIAEDYDRAIVLNESEIEAIRQEKEELLANLAEEQQQLEEYKEQLEQDKEQEISIAEFKINELTKASAEDLIKIETLEAELSKEQESHATAYAELQAENQALKDEVDKLSASLVSLEELNQTKDQRIAELTSQLNEATETVATQETLLQELEPKQEATQIAQEVIDFWGPGFTSQMYEALDKRYKHWQKAYPTEEDPGVEAILRQVCILEISINFDKMAGKAVDKNISTLNSLLSSANLTPAKKERNGKEESKENMPFGVAVRLWEENDPIPEPDPEFADVDGISKYITVWYFGHLCKMMGIKNSYSRAYEEEVARLRVERPQYEGDDDETMLDDMFEHVSLGEDEDDSDG